MSIQNYSRARKIRVSLVLILLSLLIAAPATLSANTLDDLTQQIKQVQAYIQTLQGISKNPTTGSLNMSPVFQGGLTVPYHVHEGFSGPEVLAIQKFLAQDPTIYPEGAVTGYFGAATKAAVSRFQVSCGILRPANWIGDWYGCVGPKTRAAFLGGCKVAAVAKKVVVTPRYDPPVSNACILTVNPIQGTAPLTVQIAVQANANASCTSGTYTIKTGENNETFTIPVPTGKCSPIFQAYTHTYAYTGTYPITCTSEAGLHQTVNVVVGQTIPSCTFTTSPIGDGTSGSRLSWTSTNATQAFMNNGVGNVQLAGTKDVSLTATTTYTIQFTGPGGSIICAATCPPNRFNGGCPYCAPKQ